MDAQLGHDIPSGLARLLRAISTTTLGSSQQENFRKREAVLKFREAPVFDTQDHIAYIGSGEDWQFPAALGAGTIDMVDPVFSDSTTAMRMLRNVQKIDGNARLGYPGKDCIISAVVDIGEGPKPIRLRLIATEAALYDPGYPLDGVLEFLGPTKIDGGESSPVLPNIAKKLRPGARVINFDFSEQALPNNSGWLVQGGEKPSVLRVADNKLVISLAEAALEARKNFFDHMPSSLGKR